jgi:hypothetical protein
MIPPTGFAVTGFNKTAASSLGASRIPSHLRSQAPSNLRTVTSNPEDMKMASRQTNIGQMSKLDQEKQQQWAQDYILKHGSCPEDFKWDRYEKYLGFHCQGKHHFITDEQLEELKGGVWALPTGDPDVAEGPYYPDPGQPGIFLYYGTRNDDGSLPDNAKAFTGKPKDGSTMVKTPDGDFELDFKTRTMTQISRRIPPMSSSSRSRNPSQGGSRRGLSSQSLSLQPFSSSRSYGASGLRGHRVSGR